VARDDAARRLRLRARRVERVADREHGLAHAQHVVALVHADPRQLRVDVQDRDVLVGVAEHHARRQEAAVAGAPDHDVPRAVHDVLGGDDQIGLDREPGAVARLRRGDRGRALGADAHRPEREDAQRRAVDLPVAHRGRRLAPPVPRVSRSDRRDRRDC
jgi:hypothetical protein